MTISVRFCLSYDLLNGDYIAFKVDIISMKNCIVVKDVVMTLQDSMKVFCVAISYLLHDPLNNSDII